MLTVATGFVYVLAAKLGTLGDRRQRPWPRGRTICFLAGLVALAVDLYSGIGTEADARLSVHMLEHMIMWVVVAPLLAAGAPLRLALFALPPDERRTLVLTAWTAGLHGGLHGPDGADRRMVGDGLQSRLRPLPRRSRPLGP